MRRRRKNQEEEEETRRNTRLHQWPKCLTHEGKQKEPGGEWRRWGYLDEGEDDQDQQRAEQEGAEELEIMPPLRRPECVESEADDDDGGQDCRLEDDFPCMPCPSTEGLIQKRLGE